MFQGECTGELKDYDCCTKESPCGEGQGDCDGNDENGHEDCEKGLICGVNNCRKYNPSAYIHYDCCTPPE